jgi:hypothetical protein
MIARLPPRLLAVLWALIALGLAPGHDALAVRFAVIGDYGEPGPAAAAVAALVRSWNPDFILTAGDNSYLPDIDASIGQYYHAFIHPYAGAYGPGASRNRFFPVLGNHDWDRLIDCDAGGRCTGAYLDYFALPGNERTYEIVRGPVHCFAIDSDAREPDGIDASSPQAAWLAARLAASNAPWKIVYFHHPPFSSSTQVEPRMQWPFREWGATAVVSAHHHAYERFDKAGFPYLVAGLGGRSRQPFGPPAPDSAVRFNADFGALQVEADTERITFRFYAITAGGRLIDTYTIATSPAEPATWGRVKATFR